LSCYRPKAKGELLLLLKLKLVGTVAWSNLKPEKKNTIYQKLTKTSIQKTNKRGTDIQQY